MSINWCETSFREYFILPVERFCTQSTNVINIEPTLFSKTKRSVISDQRVLQYIGNVYTPDKERADIASLAARFAIIKNIITNIGVKWQRGEVYQIFN